MNRLCRTFTVCLLVLLSLTAAARAEDGNQLASRLVALQIGEDAKAKAGDTLTKMVAPFAERENPGQEQQIESIAEKTIKPAMATGADSIAQQTAALYAQSFSQEELKQLIAFQTSPLGQKYKKFNADNQQKMRDIAKTESTDKAQDGIRQFTTQMRTAGMRVPKELDR